MVLAVVAEPFSLDLPIKEPDACPGLSRPARGEEVDSQIPD